MLAIHNNTCKWNCIYEVANAFAKLSKCQQFTTQIMSKMMIVQLQTLLQSYQNVSNSQLRGAGFRQWRRCKRFCKVIKMLAIHNQVVSLPQQVKVANAFAKLSKCQQFTTAASRSDCSFSLQTLLQSYQNVSNSQLYLYKLHIAIRCKRFCKVIKMLAIHN